MRASRRHGRITLAEFLPGNLAWPGIAGVDPQKECRIGGIGAGPPNAFPARFFNAHEVPDQIHDIRTTQVRNCRHRTIWQ